MLLRRMEKFKGELPLVLALCNPGMKDRHWKEITDISGYVAHEDFDGNIHAPILDTFMPLKELLSLNLDRHMIEVTAISETATKEFAIENTYKKMLEEWADVELPLKNHGATGTHVLSAMDDVTTLLDDHLLKMMMVLRSPYSNVFKDELADWSVKLEQMQCVLDVWFEVQSKWMYLEPIFTSQDIVAQMPVEGQNFAVVDQVWRHVMAAAAIDPHVLVATGQDGMLASLKAADTLLDEIQKGLVQYLEVKRLYFPRFFFLSNDELLEILSETKDPTRVQPHLRKCFEGISLLRFDDEMKISHMISAEGEEVALDRVLVPADANGMVEKWLSQVKECMVDSVRTKTAEGVGSYAAVPRADWVKLWPGQVVISVCSIFWTRSVEKAIPTHGGMEAYLEQCTSQINDIVEMVRGKLPKATRTSLSALIVVDVHARDVVRELTAANVQRLNDFKWIAQLRYYWEHEQLEPAPPPQPQTQHRRAEVLIKMITSTVKYGYEYLGNSGRLVITPLTDRCYRTLIGALQLDLGGAPEGPAGTGKTETSKDFAKTVAKQCIVFNCSDGMDYVMLGKFFKGVAMAGAWACFDEFNRIELEVLSVVAQQIQCIFRAKTQKVETFIFEGSELVLDPSCMVFITMNPGYAGRSELPDNLKVLFRTVAMMVPDYGLIGEISLYSMGFTNARVLANKIVAVYRLCSEQLSSQSHYDYGMRAVKAVLTCAGNLKLQYPEEDEHVLMLRSIVDVNMAKFLAHDVPLFKGIISDLFPGITLPPPDYNALRTALIKEFDKRGLQPTEYALSKIFQIYELMLVRHGFMVVGDTLGGKSSAWKLLAAALTALSMEKDGGMDDARRVWSIVINPKSMTMEQLYGSFDEVSHEWSDGVLANSFRDLVTTVDTRRKWLLFDGPVDAIWIENMNTVLDDNKKLCLMSGEIVAMSNEMSVMFEPENLLVASPATVSRVGMIYLEPHRLGWRPFFGSWLLGLPSALQTDAVTNGLTLLFEFAVDPILEYVRLNLSSYVPTSQVHQVKQLLDLFECLVEPWQVGRSDDGGGGDGEGDNSITEYGDDEGDSDGDGNGEGKRQSVTQHQLNPRFKKPATRKRQSGADHSAAADAAATAAAAAAPERKEAPSVQSTSAYLTSLFVFSIAWSIGSNLPNRDRSKLDVFVRALMTGPRPKDVKVTKQQMPPERGSIFDFFFSCKLGAWSSWTDQIKSETIPLTAKPETLIISTAETARQIYFLNLFVHNDRPVLFVGPTGTGKSAVVNDQLLQLRKQKFVPVNLNLSAQTSAKQVQDIVLSKLSRRRKGVMGPSVEHQCIVFVDDLNMPIQEEYGAQPPIELLRQLADHAFWYDHKDTSQISMVDISMVAAMGPPGGGRNEITARFVRWFNIIGIDSFDDRTMTRIFSTIVRWHFSKEGYDAGFRVHGSALVTATTGLFTSVVAQLLPTPAKSHYLFNLRDVARVMQGVMLVPPECLQDSSKLLRLWVHEVHRVFQDRLVDDTDRQKFFDLADEVCTAAFRKNLQALLPALKEKGGKSAEAGVVQVVGAQVTVDSLRGLFFGDYMVIDAEPRKYDEVESLDRLKNVMEEYLDNYNQAAQERMSLVMFQFAIEHISRIARILKQPNGHALLVGMGGSGRQSTVKLAAHMGEYEVFQIKLNKGYSRSDWLEDVRKMHRRAGQDGIPSCFLLADSQIVDEAMLEDINMLLNTGDIANLYEPEELAEIVDAMIKLRQGNDASEEGAEMDTSTMAMYNMFVQRVRSNLHICLAMSYVGDTLRARLRQFPSLVNCCTIDWFQPWPADALEMVANTFLSDVAMDDPIRCDVVVMCQHFHSSVRELAREFQEVLRRHYYITPTSYLELIKTFKVLLHQKRNEVQGLQNRYEGGLVKLNSAEVQVDEMKTELLGLGPQLEQTSLEVTAAMEVIANETAAADKVKEIVSADEAVAAKAAGVANGIKDECEADLSTAIPALNEALSALDTLKPADIGEIKVMNNPPAGVKLVMEAVCVMKGVKAKRIKDTETGEMVNDFWISSKILLGDASFLATLKQFDKDSIPASVMKTIRTKYLPDPLFVPDIVAKASKAAEGLCAWVRAMDTYDRVIRVVAPKQEKLKEAMGELAVQTKLLDGKRAELQGVLDQLTSLTEGMQAKAEQKGSLEDNIELCTVRLARAEQLISGLGGEKDRWGKAATDLGELYTRLTGDVLLSSGVISYLGAFTPAFRNRCVNDWAKRCADRQIPSSAGFSLSASFGNPVVIRDWHIAGLPVDTFSTENGIIVTTAERWPLMIDPQGQANKWIRRVEANNELEVIKLSSPNWIRRMEASIQFGHPALLENVEEELDPILDSLLLKQTFTQAGELSLRFGDGVVPYHPDFKLYVTTRMRNPHYLPEVAVKVTMVNFMITSDGLEDQLLGKVAAMERPELEESKNKLVRETAENKRQLQEIEDKILEVLASSEGNILDDENAVRILSSSKVLSTEIAEKQVVAEKTGKEIDAARALYMPVAVFSSVLFFSIADLSSIEPMYQYSLNWFTDLYGKSVSESEPDEDVSTRVETINAHFTESIYRNVCRSLFEKDKLLFSFILCVSIMRGRGEVDDAEWRFLLTGGVGVGTDVPNPAPAWLPKARWSEVTKAAAMLPAFAGFDTSVADNVSAWRAFYDSATPFSDSLPSPWQDQLSDVQALIALRLFRPDKMTAKVTSFVRNNFGDYFTAPPPFNLAAAFEDSQCCTALIFVLSPGSDPMSAVTTFADAKGMAGDKIGTISLGQGQGPVAENMIKSGMADGKWVVLQNCHLCTSWMPELEYITEEIMTADATHLDFRLWLTSYPSSAFPVSILENGVKMTNESPKGLRSNLLRSFANDPISDPHFFANTDKPARWEKMLFSLCFFHALVQERRQFGPLGFNIPYGFDDSDLRISIRQMQTFVNDYDELPLEALTYCVGQCNYGGRVTDDWDRRCLLSLLGNLFAEVVIDDDCYTFSPSGLYFAPPKGSYEDYVAYLHSLPEIAPPEVFGMHGNADISKDQKETNMLFAGILCTLPRQSSAAAGKGPNEVVGAMCSSILADVAEPFDTEAIGKKYPVLYEESMNTVLLQECVRFNRLVKVVRVSLQNIKKAIVGVVIMSQELEGVYDAILLGRIPSQWAKASYPSLKPLGGRSKSSLATKNLLEDTDGLRRPP